MNSSLQGQPNGFTAITYLLDCLLKSQLKVFPGLAAEFFVRHALMVLCTHQKLTIENGRPFPWHLRGSLDHATLGI